MSTLTWSEKQKRTIVETFEPGTKRVIVPGPTQSGKSMSAAYAFLYFASYNWSGYDFAMVSRSEQQFSRVLLKYMREFAGMYGLNLSRKSSGEWLMDSAYGKQRNTFYRVLAGDQGSVDRAYGPTVAAVLFDEFPRLEPDAVSAVESRASVRGSVLLYTGNPEGPLHWAKQKYVDRAEEDRSFGVHLPFSLWDNPEMTDEYVDSLSEIYSGAMLQRMRDGLWVEAEGAIYNGFYKRNVKRPPAGEPSRYEVCMDDAMRGVTHALLLGQYPDAWYVVDEYRWHVEMQGPKDPFQKAKDIIRKFTSGGRHVSWWVCDPAPAALSLRTAVEYELKAARISPMTVHPGDNDVLEGIALVDQWLNRGRVFFSPSVTEAIREHSNYSWDAKAARRGVTQPLKEDDHSCDAFRYWAYTKAGKQARPQLTRSNQNGDTATVLAGGDLTASQRRLLRHQAHGG